MAEFDRRRFAAVLAADAALEHRALAAALEYGLADQLSHAVLVEDLERVVLQDALVEVDRQELADVVAREAQRLPTRRIIKKNKLRKNIFITFCA